MSSEQKIILFDITKFLPCSFIFSIKDYEDHQSKFSSKIKEIHTMFKVEYQCKEAMNEVFEWLVEIHEMSHLMALTLAMKIVKEIKEKLFLEISKGAKETSMFKFWNSTLDQFHQNALAKISQLRVIFTQKEPWTIDSILQLPQMATSSDMFASVLRTWFSRIHIKWRSGNDEELLTAIYSCQRVLHSADGNFFNKDSEKLLLFLFFIVELHEVFIDKLDTDSEQRIDCLQISTVYLKRIIPLASSISTNFAAYYIVHTASILQTISSEVTVFMNLPARLKHLNEGIEYLTKFFLSPTSSFDYVLVASAYEIFSDLYRQTASCWEALAETANNNNTVKMFKSLQAHIYEAYALVELVYWKDELMAREKKISHFPQQMKAYEELRLTYEKSRATLVLDVFELLENIWNKAVESAGHTWAYNKSFWDISGAMVCICVRLKERILDKKMYQVQLDWCEKFLKRTFTEVKINLDLYFHRLCSQVLLNNESTEEVYVSMSQYMKIYGNLDKDVMKRSVCTFDPTVLKSVMFPMAIRKRPVTESEIRSLLSIAHFEYKLAGRVKDAEKTLLLVEEEYRQWFACNNEEKERSFEKDYGLFKSMVDRAFGDVYFAMSRESEKVELKQELALLHKSLEYFKRAYTGARTYCMIPGVGDDKFRENIRNLLLQLTPVQMKPLSLTFSDQHVDDSDEELLLSIQKFLEDCTSQRDAVEERISHLQEVLLVLTTENMESETKTVKEKEGKKQKKVDKQIRKQQNKQKQMQSHVIKTEISSDSGRTSCLILPLEENYSDESCFPFTPVMAKKKKDGLVKNCVNVYKDLSFREKQTLNENKVVIDKHSSEKEVKEEEKEAVGLVVVQEDEEEDLEKTDSDTEIDPSDVSTLSESTVVTSPFPDFFVPSSVVGALSEDIHKFCSTSQEVLDKNWTVFSRLRDMFIYNFMSFGLDLVCYGSLQTNLTNSSSDVDVIVINSRGQDSTREEVDLVLSWLQQEIFDEVSVRTCTTSPIGISLIVFKMDKVNVDMSFMTQSHQGVVRTSLISSELQYRGFIGEHVSQVTRILKEILHSKGWNKPHTGGISGYILFYLVLFCADIFCSTFGAIPDSSGTLLHFFFYYYGGIWKEEPLVLKHRVKLVKFDRDRHSSSSSEDTLWVSDPLQPHRNIASRCSSFREIFTFFGKVYTKIKGLLSHENVLEKLFTFEFP
jgi:hypothetical protein